jgi:protein Tex
MDIKAHLITEFSLQPVQIENTLALLDEGATIPFIARYRKERTGSLDETVLRDIEHKYVYYKELEERRATILASIEEQGKLTPELKAKIEATISKVELEDLYLPYKPKRVTRGKKALDAGLEPLARRLVECSEPAADLLGEAVVFVTDKAREVGFDTPEKAIAGACDILAEELSEDAEVRKWLRTLASDKGVVASVVRKEFAEQKTKYQMYYDYKEPVKNIPSHRALAMFRGEREKVLRLELIMPRDEALAHLLNKLVKHPQSASAAYLSATAGDCFDRLLSLATETEIRLAVREKAEVEAFAVFGANLRALLLAPPAGQKAILGIDPGYRTGCKVVTLDATGKLLEHDVLYATLGEGGAAKAKIRLLELIDKYNVELIAIGNGTASRETDTFVRDALKELPLEKRPPCVVVSEAGASVYSASELAVKEFPDQDVTVRGAVSIGRRLQDPLSELVKIDPKAIGVGQYQHDVNQTTLKKSLEEVVESCVNRVGVNLNLASAELLRYVSGLTSRTADAIVKYRNAHGAFDSRAGLLEVPGLGPKTYEQAAGFLRIPGATNPLDNSSVHPERYALVMNIAGSMSTSVDKLIGNTAALGTVDKKKFVSDEIGLPTLEDILRELEKPGRDPREEFTYATFNDAVKEIKDLTPGMKLEGTVTNVTNFGAFVDIGVHQDGLVHISQLADRYVTDPNQVVKPGQIVSVTVLEIDPELKRIALSMKKDTQANRPATDKGERKPQPEKSGDKRRPPATVREQPRQSQPKLSDVDRLKLWAAGGMGGQNKKRKT